MKYILRATRFVFLFYLLAVCQVSFSMHFIDGFLMYAATKMSSCCIAMVETNYEVNPRIDHHQHNASLVQAVQAQCPDCMQKLLLQAYSFDRKENDGKDLFDAWREKPDKVIMALLELALLHKTEKIDTYEQQLSQFVYYDFSRCAPALLMKIRNRRAQLKITELNENNVCSDEQERECSICFELVTPESALLIHNHNQFICIECYAEIKEKNNTCSVCEAILE